MSSAPPTPSPARTPRAERSRQRILDAAGQCFAASGYAKTTIEEVASRAGVSKGLVHHHFGTKERILEAVVERTLAKWDALSRVEAMVSGGSVLEGIAEMHRASIAYARENPALHALIEMDGRVLLDAGIGRAVRSVMQRLRAALVDTVRIGIESGELREDSRRGAGSRRGSRTPPGVYPARHRSRVGRRVARCIDRGRPGHPPARPRPGAAMKTLARLLSFAAVFGLAACAGSESELGGGRSRRRLGAPAPVAELVDTQKVELGTLPGGDRRFWIGAGSPCLRRGHGGERAAGRRLRRRRRLRRGGRSTLPDRPGALRDGAHGSPRHARAGACRARQRTERARARGEARRGASGVPAPPRRAGARNWQ